MNQETQVKLLKYLNKFPVRSLFIYFYVFNSSRMYLAIFVVKILPPKIFPFFGQSAIILSKIISVMI